ncbi:LOW QUALITY PROTEIN: P-selectin-like [Hippoglossus stenolepis]|uniref:LOW QUALITY PROTEIN: P-selectin-like n=1 Tax=Hippoglossus stenolepis TaxID=195615 RepID=UPI001FAFA63D|nr:LOW QUALITY PROTEIN: P-selectin-like [Hippoglossus stenolepis]
MMSQESVDIRQSLHHRVLIAALIVFTQDLSSGGGAQAWTYNYSITPNRRWLQASQWCQEHFTDMVTIQSQEEMDFINKLLPYNAKYYWIGVHRVDGVWIRVGTNETVPEDAQNWAPEEPDSIVGQDCVEIYFKRDKDIGMWNNEKCRTKKGTVCYSASCTQDSCSAHAECVETIGNYTCQCHLGFHGPRCEEVEQCPALNHTNSSGGRMNCSDPIASYSYNSTCEVRCDEGYELSGDGHIRCDHTGQWTASVPACTVKKCAPIFSPVMGNVTCMGTLESFSFGSWCDFTCQEGYYLSENSTLTCLASGQWSKPTPTCAVVQCNRLEAPPHASMQCQGPLGVYSYDSICTVQCEEGFELISTNKTKCSSQGHWSHALPLCQAKRCIPQNKPSHGSLSCSDPNGSDRFGSRCTSTCDEGFLLNGTSSTECTSLGTWNADIPRCLARRCPTLNSPTNGSLSCSRPHGEFRFGSRCTSACEEGFLLNGTADTECTSLGTWNADTPLCTAKRCPALNPPSHGSLSCSRPHGEFRFGSRCTSACEEGFLLNGTADTECTSLGTWTADIPRCQARRCPTLNSPTNGSLFCSRPHGEFSFGSRCTSSCEEGFVLNGTSSAECTSVGTWNADIPRCQARRCPTLNSPTNGSLSCSRPHGEFRFGSRCTSACEEGFLLNGTADTECTSLGTWNADTPLCTAKRCPALNPPSHGSLSCSRPHGEFRFGSRCTSACEEGFLLNGTADTECTSLGTWNADIPRCQARRCPTLNSPTNGSLSCSRPHGEFSFGSRCTSACEEGFVLNGTSSAECTSVGTWNADIPRCQARRCPTLNSPTNGSLSCSRPHGEFRFGSRCTSACEEGFLLNGTADTECTSLGTWNADTPLCTAKRCPALNPPSHGSLSCSKPHGEFSFGSRCTSSCDEGFLLNGTSSSECTSLGTWSTDLPHCLARPCPLLAEAPQHGRMNCSHPYSTFSYDSHCDFGCTEGFWLRGTPTVTCSSSGHWSRDLPTCELVQCEAIRALSLPLSVNCSHPLGNFSFGSQCLFTCKDRFSLNGTEVLLCSSTGFWSDGLPNCTEDLPVGAAMLMFTGVAATSLLVPLALIGLAMLILTRFKRRGNTARSDAPLWEERENPAFEF